MSKKIVLLSTVICLTVYISVGFTSELGYEQGELLVRFAPKPDGKQQTIAERNELLTSIGGGTVKRCSKFVPGLTLVKLPEGMSVQNAIGVFKNADGILSAQPNYIYKTLSTFPNDPRFDELWGMHNTGQSFGTPDADIDAPEAWDIHTGSSEIIVAVIDTGIDYNHPDLAGNMWVNPGEIPGNDIDDDNNGYVDDVYGYDFCTFGGHQRDSDPMDDRYHGTHCAGTIGTIGDNNEGVTGVCWNVKIMAVKFMDDWGSGNTADAIESINYAVAMGAKVLSNSWGGTEYDPDLKNVIKNAEAEGVLFVAAAGNPEDDKDPNNDTTPRYPASYDCNNIIAVMATDHDDERSIWPVPKRSSAYGPISVDLGTPGTDILSTFPTYETEAMAYYEFSTDYETISGTSMAAPHVAGACALVWSLNPCLSHLEVKDILLQTVDKTLPVLCVSEGRLNLHNALIKAGKWADPLAKTDNLDPNDSVSPADSITYTISYENNLKDPNDPNLPFGTLTNVTITDSLPEEVDYEPTSDPNYDPNNHTYTWNIGTLEPNESNSVTLTVTVNGLAVPSGTILNICVIDANEIAPVTAIEITDVNAWVPDVIYVDKDANDFGTGLSWEKAFIDLQDGLEAAETYGSNQIWVAAANEPYTPTTEPNLNATFQLINGAALYGGFPPGGGQWTDRNSVAYETVLSGDTDEDIYADVYYLVTCSSINEATIIDGFTITKGGYAGIRCINNASPIIQNNKITDNDGIGIDCDHSDPNIINCVIEDNDPYGIYCSSSNPTIINCLIQNSAHDGLYCVGNSSVVVRNTEIKNNGSDGIYSDSSELNLADCHIENNDDYGLYCKSGSPFITNSIISKNDEYGIYIYNTSPTVTPVIKNSWICDNGSSSDCGIYLGSADSIAVIRNTTVAGNAGYGIARSSGGPDPNISSCIVWNNGDDLYDCTAIYSCIENNDSGEGNIHTDPCFVDDANDNYHLEYDSPCEDAGDPNFNDANETDIDGQPRNMGDCIKRVDIGADEIYFPPCWNCLTQCHGDADCSGFVDISDWPPFRDGFAKSYPDPNYIENVCGDFTRDGAIGIADFSEYRDWFAKSPPADCNCGGCWPPGSCEGEGRGQSSGDTTDDSLLEDMIKWIIEHDLPAGEEFLRRLYELL